MPNPKECVDAAEAKDNPAAWAMRAAKAVFVGLPRGDGITEALRDKAICHAATIIEAEGNAEWATALQQIADHPVGYGDLAGAEGGARPVCDECKQKVAIARAALAPPAAESKARGA